ncbi:MAG: type IV pilus inner membrane component PilO [Planctomycetota bacterium]|jgi:Tfp pilus assembly protein PilO
MRRGSIDSWIVLTLVVAAVGLSALLIYAPQGHELQELRSRIDLLKTAQTKDFREASTGPEMVRRIEKMKRRYQNFHRPVTKRNELDDPLREINDILSSEQLANQSIEPAAPIRKDIYHTVGVVMKFEGSYLSLGSLLKRIDEMKHVTRVRKLSISGTPEQRDLDVEMHMNIYFLES